MDRAFAGGLETPILPLLGWVTLDLAVGFGVPICKTRGQDLVFLRALQVFSISQEVWLYMNWLNCHVGDSEGAALFEAQNWGPLRCLEQNVAHLEPLVSAVSAPQGKGLSGGQSLQQWRLQKQRVDAHRFAPPTVPAPGTLADSGLPAVSHPQIAVPHPVRCHSGSGREGHIGWWLIVWAVLNVRPVHRLLEPTRVRGPDRTDSGCQPLGDSGSSWTTLFPLHPLPG